MKRSIYTHHANKQYKKRVKLSKKKKQELADNALEYGLDFWGTKGRLKKYLYHLYKIGDETADNIKVYKNFVFVFRENILITIYSLPGNLVNYMGKKK